MLFRSHSAALIGNRNLELRRIAGAGMFQDAESDVSTITIGVKSGLCYDGFLSGISTRNREPLYSMRPAFFSLLSSTDMALRSTPR